MATKYSLTPEQLDSMLLDANAVGLISGVYDRYQARDVIRKILDYVEHFELSYTALITFILQDTENADLLAQIVSRHLLLFKSDQLIFDYDKGLIIKHLDHQLALLGG